MEFWNFGVMGNSETHYSRIPSFHYSIYSREEFDGNH
jgi:hypothetical protein